MLCRLTSALASSTNIIMNVSSSVSIVSQTLSTRKLLASKLALSLQVFSHYYCNICFWLHAWLVGRRPQNCRLYVEAFFVDSLSWVIIVCWCPRRCNSQPAIAWQLQPNTVNWLLRTPVKPFPLMPNFMLSMAQCSSQLQSLLKGLTSIQQLQYVPGIIWLCCKAVKGLTLYRVQSAFIMQTPLLIIILA